MYEANNKLLENYSFRRFESGGIRKTANFVPCVLATKLTVKMAKTLDISRVQIVDKVPKGALFFCKKSRSVV